MSQHDRRWYFHFHGLCKHRCRRKVPSAQSWTLQYGCNFTQGKRQGLLYEFWREYADNSLRWRCSIHTLAAWRWFVSTMIPDSFIVFVWVNWKQNKPISTLIDEQAIVHFWVGYRHTEECGWTHSSIWRQTSSLENKNLHSWLISGVFQISAGGRTITDDYIYKSMHIWFHTKFILSSLAVSKMFNVH